MKVQRIAAFCQGDQGGNPAGVVLLEAPENEAEMARVAVEVGYSETVFAVPLDDEAQKWRVRYFSPESEVPFCGHATIALGAVLGDHSGPGTYGLVLNDAEITVNCIRNGDEVSASLLSPPTESQALNVRELQETLDLFGLDVSDLDARLAPARIHAGSNHIMLPISERVKLAEMNYDLDDGRQLMRRHGLVTIMLVYIEDVQMFVVRNAFASAGVFEDPATGAAAAAFAGYLRDNNWPHSGRFTVRQGEDMGQPSIIEVQLTDVMGSSVQVSGRARVIE